MRPLLVRMQGFGPFREPTEVDFRDVELVALMGTTGSGKSTILDAITFSLFGQIARLDARAVAPVINALSQEARVGFEFELGGQVYTAVRVVRRTKTGASTKEARLERGDESIAASSDEVGQEIERLLGMNFDRFTKVAFLPQGKFAEFLHDKPAERQKLLRVLLGLGMYEQIGQAARRIAVTAENQLDVLRPQLTEAGVTDEQIAELGAAAVELRELRDDVTTRLEKRAELAAELERLRVTAEEFGVLTLAVAAVDVPGDVVSLGERATAADRSLALAEQALAAADAAYAAAADARAKGPDAANLERWREGYARAAELTRRVADLERAAVDATEARARAEEAGAALAASLTELRDATEHAEAAEDAAERAAAQARSAEAIELDRQAHSRLAELADRIEHATSDDGKLAEAEAAEATAGTNLELAQAGLRAARDGLRHAERTGHVAVLARSLEAGDECPVCRQVIDELPAQDADSTAAIDHAERTVRQAEAALDDAERARSDANRTAVALRTTLDALRTQHDELADRVAGLPPIHSLDAEATERVRLAAAFDEARTAADRARRAERAAREGDEAVAINRRVSETAAAEAAATAALESARASLAEAQAALDGAPARATVDEQLLEAESLARAETAAGQDRRDAATAVETARADRAEIGRDEGRIRREFGTVRDGFVGIDPPQPGHDSLLADWQAFAAWAAGLREPLEAHHRATAERAEAVQDDVAATDRAIVERCAEHDDLADLPSDADVAMLGSHIERRLASAVAEAQSARHRQEQMAQTRQTVAELEESHDVHELLGIQLRSSGFEQWLLDEVIQSLVDRASDRLFDLSRGQYSIEADAMSFQVRDHRNGDELRDARTLSGGETFLASLALALALADSIEEMAPTDTPPVECLFLDEGFGTLDPETLDIVAGAIEELGASGRMVGVITHIRELAERMPVRFEVTKQATTSVVERVVA